MSDIQTVVANARRVVDGLAELQKFVATLNAAFRDSAGNDELELVLSDAATEVRALHETVDAIDDLRRVLGELTPIQSPFQGVGLPPDTAPDDTYNPLAQRAKMVLR